MNHWFVSILSSIASVEQLSSTVSEASTNFTSDKRLGQSFYNTETRRAKKHKRSSQVESTTSDGTCCPILLRHRRFGLHWLARWVLLRRGVFIVEQLSSTVSEAGTNFTSDKRLGQSFYNTETRRAKKHKRSSQVESTTSDGTCCPILLRHRRFGLHWLARWVLLRRGVFIVEQLSSTVSEAGANFTSDKRLGQSFYNRVDYVADESEIRRGKQFPYRYFAAHLNRLFAAAGCCQPEACEAQVRRHCSR